MADISQIIAPKSDQLNSDDLITGDRTIHIRDVKVLGSGKEQPIWIFFEGDDGKPWKPCKTMARLLAQIWKEPETQKWIGRSVTLYRDPEVTWAGAKIGGIRVRAVSHIDAPRQIAVSESKQRRKLTTIGVVKADVREIAPLAKRHQPANSDQQDAAAEWASEHIAALAQVDSMDALEDHIERGTKAVAKLASNRPELHQKVQDAYAVRRKMLTFPGEAE